MENEQNGLEMVFNGEEREFEGSTVAEAIKKAAKELRVQRDHMEVKVVCEEKRGLFGMQGAKLAKIKVSLKRVPRETKG